MNKNIVYIVYRTSEHAPIQKGFNSSLNRKVFWNSSYLLKVFLCFLFIGIAAPMLPIAAQSHENELDFQQEDIQSKNKINKDKWKKTGDAYDYNKEKKKKEKKEEEPEEVVEENKKPKMSEETQNIIKYSLFGVVIVLLAFIALRLIGGGTVFGNKKIEKEKVYTLEEIEENLHEVDVEAFLNTALENKDYRLAIRLYYLNILKSLSLSGQIQWKKDKTNGMYLREMQNSPLWSDLKTVTLIYEYVWFSEPNFNAAQYESVRPNFRNLLSQAEKGGQVTQKSAKE